MAPSLGLYVKHVVCQWPGAGKIWTHLITGNTLLEWEHLWWRSCSFGCWSHTNATFLSHTYSPSLSPWHTWSRCLLTSYNQSLPVHDESRVQPHPGGCSWTPCAKVPINSQVSYSVSRSFLQSLKYFPIKTHPAGCEIGFVVTWLSCFMLRKHTNLSSCS